jgi:hypothetical protein
MLKYLLILFSITTISSYIKNKDGDKSDFTNSKIKPNPKFRKECEIKEACRPCTFEELKNADECKYTGFKEIKYCTVYDGERIDTDYYSTDSCDSYGINPTYYYLLLFISTGLLSLLMRKYYRKMMLLSTLEKITILKDK